MAKALPLLLLVLGQFLSLLGFRDSSTETLHKPLSTEVTLLDAATQGKPQRLYVTVGNHSSTILRALRITIDSEAGVVASHLFGDLGIGQWQTVFFELPGSGAKELALSVFYTADNIPNRVTTKISLQNNKVSSTNNFRTTLLPAIFGLLGAVGGSGLTAYLTNKRELARMKYEWSKSKFQLYEAHYRQFMRRVGGTVDPGQIRLFFDQLEDNAIITPGIRAELDATLKFLEKETNKDKKTLARDTFLDKFGRFVLDPT